MSPEPCLLLERIRLGDDTASAEVFARFVDRLVALAASQIGTWLRHKIDPEDVVQSVCRSFFRRHKAGQFHVSDWDSLWHLLALITVRKCVNQVERWGARKRSVCLERPLAGPLPGREPSPEDAAILTETLEGLMTGLSPREREILSLHLQGYDFSEIAGRVGRTRRTVRRALDHVRAELCRPQDG